MNRAWQVHEHGDPAAVLRLDEVPVPQPGPGQVRLRVAATSCNFADVLLCRGTYQLEPDSPFTPGLEVCGVVEDLGPGVDAALRGMRVVGAPVLPRGGFADSTVLDATDAHPVPAGIDDATAATLHLTYLTAWLGLHRRAGLQAGECVVITAAAGGVGSAALQLARAAGARVIAIVSGADKAATAASLGADVVVDRSREDVLAAVRTAAPHGADVVFDTVGGAAYQTATKYIGFEGRILVVGFASGTIPQQQLNHAFVKNYTIAGLHWSLYRHHRPDLVRTAQAHIFDLAAAGAIDPLITARLGLDRVPDALQRLARGDTQGKTVITL